jgi:hypothetical protein
MKDNSAKWKNRLLSSSLPLEFEIAKHLVNEDFYVDFDYSYKRLDEKEEKDFSIDISAGGFYPFGVGDEIKLKTHFLVECKYRNPNVNWIFLPDINNKDYTIFSSQGPLKFLDEFSEFRSKHSGNLLMLDTCLKGMEINMENGEVHDRGITHGINQLVYGLPAVLESAITDCLLGHLTEIYPYFICPILVTTSKLYIVREEFDIEKVKRADNLKEFADEVPYLSFYSDLYPSFKNHCKNIFENILGTSSLDRYEYFRKLREIDPNLLKKKNPTPEETSIMIDSMMSQPKMLLDELKLGFGSDFFREVIICNSNEFLNLIKICKEVIESTANKMTKVENIPNKQ